MSRLASLASMIGQRTLWTSSRTAACSPVSARRTSAGTGSFGDGGAPKVGMGGSKPWGRPAASGKFLAKRRALARGISLGRGPRGGGGVVLGSRLREATMITRVLRRGMRGDDVEEWQLFLIG